MQICEEKQPETKCCSRTGEVCTSQLQCELIEAWCRKVPGVGKPFGRKTNSILRPDPTLRRIRIHSLG